MWHQSPHQLFPVPDTPNRKSISMNLVFRRGLTSGSKANPTVGVLGLRLHFGKATVAELNGPQAVPVLYNGASLQDVLVACRPHPHPKTDLSFRLMWEQRRAQSRSPIFPQVFFVLHATPPHRFSPITYPALSNLGRPPLIDFVDRWPAQEHAVHLARVPTAVLYDEEGSVSTTPPRKICS